MPQFLRYLATGLLCAGLEYFSFLFLHQVLGWALVPANSLAYALGLTSSFLLNKFFVFNTPQTQGVHQQMLAYGLLALFNYTAGTWLLVYLVRSLAIPAWIGKAITMGTVALWNFFVYKKVVYR